MSKRVLCLVLCLALFVCLTPVTAFAAIDYDTVVIEEGDTVKKLVEDRGLDYDVEKYVVMVLNQMDKERQMELLSVGETILIPKTDTYDAGRAPHLISTEDTVAYYVIPYYIQSGDTLRFIYKLWGLDYNRYAPLIKSLNPEKNTDLLYVYERYFLPTTESNLKTDTYVTVMSHVMLKNETAERVFSRYGIDFKERREDLQRYNLTPFDKLKEGDTLLIPLLWE